MMNRRGQATTEMMYLMPLLIMVLGGSMFIVYSCWQGIKVQQAANLAARVQGQERVSGGTSLPDIDQQNGVGAAKSGDDDPTDSSQDPFKKFDRPPRGAPGASVYEKFYLLVKKMFPGAQDQVYVPPPLIGQNVDKVKVVRVINLLPLPFLKWFGAEQIKLQGTAWGGEDTYMYALPRWGQTGSGNGFGNAGTPEWKNLIKESGQSGKHD